MGKTYLVFYRRHKRFGIASTPSRSSWSSTLIALLMILAQTSCSNPQNGISSTTTITSSLAIPSATAVNHTGPSFPRLGMWWPNGWHQPLEDIARYDWVILGYWQSQFLDPLRALNPHILLLTSTDACELHYYPNDPANNQEILKIPYQWFLTQVGSTLSADIDSKQTSLPVNAITTNNGNKTIDLFLPGDYLLIENESVFVESVDKTNKTLTVKRGYVRPASVHKAGTRIAAHVSTWPDTWMLNVSTLSPPAVADPSIGPEIWPEYNARIGANLLIDPRWAGILIDRSDTDQSRYIDGSTIRSIDPDQSNRLLRDYSAFDTTWNDGLRLYLDNLRQAIGSQRIIFLNWGIDYYQSVNGNNFEGFPNDAGGLGDNSWDSVVFGPFHRGSYFDWIKKSPQPNITMIETYEDNSVPSGTYNNLCEQPGFQPNFRKMRFGLTTTLLNNGYFSYEMNTDGHGSLCLMWFDEYDNAGVGRGYLGYPLGDASQVESFRLTPNTSEVDIWQREYENGIVLVNAASTPVAISLEGTFRKIKGTQDSLVNDGSLVTQVTLQPKDGIILLRP
jgi:hypothetical protein